MFFHLALTSGLDADAPAAVPRAVRRLEEVRPAHGEPFPLQGTVATTDGDSFYGFRYSSSGQARSLFHSTDISTLRAMYPDNPLLADLTDDARVVVSEPLGQLRGAWREVPPSTCVI